MRWERREVVWGERERMNEWKCVVRAIQGGIKREETFDTIFEGCVGLGFDRKQEGKDAETPTRDAPPPYPSGQTAGLPAAGSVDRLSAISHSLNETFVHFPCHLLSFAAKTTCMLPSEAELLWLVRGVCIWMGVLTIDIKYWTSSNGKVAWSCLTGVCFRFWLFWWLLNYFEPCPSFTFLCI